MFQAWKILKFPHNRDNYGAYCNPFEGKSGLKDHEHQENQLTEKRLEALALEQAQLAMLYQDPRKDDYTAALKETFKAGYHLRDTEVNKLKSVLIPALKILYAAIDGDTNNKEWINSINDLTDSIYELAEIIRAK